MQKQISKIKRHNLISDNIEKGFSLAFFGLMIVIFVKPFYGIIVFTLAIIYFVIYFCILSPKFKKYEINIKNTINNECKMKLDDWYNNLENKEEIMEKYSKYMGEEFLKTREKIFLEGKINEEHLLDILIDIDIITSRANT